VGHHNTELFGEYHKDLAQDTQGFDIMKAHHQNNCPILATHEKYNEAVYFLCKTMEAYHRPEEFRFNLNAFIQAFRNITFMLQSEAVKPSNFEQWYSQKRLEMSDNRLMRAFVVARNVIVKQSTLATRSTIQAGLFRGRDMKMAIQIEISPFAPTLCVLGQCIRTMVGTFVDEKHSDIGEQLGVERKWVVEEIGDEEIVGLNIKGMEYIGKLLSEAHALYDLEYKPQDFSSVDMKKVMVLLESDVDPNLPKKWGW
jgi:hypothetical protein